MSHLLEKIRKIYLMKEKFVFVVFRFISGGMSGVFE